jgi:hypothetical protein
MDRFVYERLNYHPFVWHLFELEASHVTLSTHHQVSGKGP